MLHISVGFMDLANSCCMKVSKPHFAPISCECDIDHVSVTRLFIITNVFARYPYCIRPGAQKFPLLWIYDPFFAMFLFASIQLGVLP